MPTLHRRACAASALFALSWLSGCSTSFWYTQIQAAQYEKCERLASAEDRRRCKAETSIDKERYDKERQRVSGSST
ncbi:MAG: hypothetical protein Q8M96_04685 [Rubrivivax sp.]|nr:hypothetical protein [Rubrivivax sp.]